jgi:hypothetical protein
LERESNSNMEAVPRPSHLRPPWLQAMGRSRPKTDAQREVWRESTACILLGFHGRQPLHLRAAVLTRWPWLFYGRRQPSIWVPPSRRAGHGSSLGGEPRRRKGSQARVTQGSDRALGARQILGRWRFIGARG